MKNISALFILLAFGLPAISPAQPLAWDNCVQEATANNQDLLSAVQSWKSAENSKLASLGQFLPQISLSGSLNRSGSDDSFEGALGNPNYGQNASLSLSARENIFSGLKDVASVDNANAQLDLAKSQLAQAKAQLSRDLKSAFYQLLFSQKQVELLQSIAGRNKSNENLVGLNYKGGTDNKGSWMQAQAASAQADYEVGQAKRALSVARQQLAQLLGRKVWEGLAVAGEFDIPSSVPSPGDFNELTLKTPAHRQALAQLHLSESQYMTARSPFFPTLSANASLSRQGGTFDGLDNPGWSAGLQLSYPLFTGGQDLFNLKSAEESKKGAEARLASADMKTALQLQNTWAAYQDAVERTSVQSAFRKASEIRQQIGKAEYLNGLLSFQNWDQLESDLTNQQKSELQSLLNAKNAQANWELSQGKGDIR